MSRFDVDYSRFANIEDSDDDEPLPAAAPDMIKHAQQMMPKDLQQAVNLLTLGRQTGDKLLIKQGEEIAKQVMKREPKLRQTYEDAIASQSLPCKKETSLSDKIEQIKSNMENQLRDLKARSTEMELASDKLNHLQGPEDTMEFFKEQGFEPDEIQKLMSGDEQVAKAVMENKVAGLGGGIDGTDMAVVHTAEALSKLKHSNTTKDNAAYQKKGGDNHTQELRVNLEKQIQSLRRSQSEIEDNKANLERKHAQAQAALQAAEADVLRAGKDCDNAQKKIADVPAKELREFERMVGREQSDMGSITPLDPVGETELSCLNSSIAPRSPPVKTQVGLFEMVEKTECATPGENDAAAVLTPLALRSVKRVHKGGRKLLVMFVKLPDHTRMKDVQLEVSSEKQQLKITTTANSLTVPFSPHNVLNETEIIAKFLRKKQELKITLPVT